MDLGNYPFVFMLVGFLIPLIYCLFKRNENVRKTAILFLVALFIVLMCPIYLKIVDASWSAGLVFSQLVLFLVIPFIVVMRIEHWSVKQTLIETGITDKNVVKSLLYGLLAAFLMICVYYLFTTGGSTWDTYYVLVMFITAIGEEFLFRGVLLLYMKNLTGVKVALVASILGFILMHGQYLDNRFIIPTAVQAIILAVVVIRTDSIIGSWIGHGLTRFVPGLLRTVFP